MQSHMRKENKMTVYEYLKSGISKETELYEYYVEHKDDIIALRREYETKLSALKAQIISDFIKDKNLDREPQVSDEFYNYMNGIEEKFVQKALEGVSPDEMKKVYVDRLVESLSVDGVIVRQS